MLYILHQALRWLSLLEKQNYLALSISYILPSSRTGGALILRYYVLTHPLNLQNSATDWFFHNLHTPSMTCYEEPPDLFRWDRPLIINDDISNPFGMSNTILSPNSGADWFAKDPFDLWSWNLATAGNNDLALNQGDEVVNGPEFSHSYATNDHALSMSYEANTLKTEDNPSQELLVSVCILPLFICFGFCICLFDYHLTRDCQLISSSRKAKERRGFQSTTTRAITSHILLPI